MNDDIKIGMIRQSMSESSTILDSGERREFESGAVRDARPGVGRCDLLPLDVVSVLISKEQSALCYDPVIGRINSYVRNGEKVDLYSALSLFIKFREWDKYTAILEVSKQYEDGAKKYNDRNWEKGIPLHCYIDSGVRHYLKWLRGDTDEPHDRAFLWNMLGAIWTHENRPEMIDLPFNDKKEG